MNDSSLPFNETSPFPDKKFISTITKFVPQGEKSFCNTGISIISFIGTTATSSTAIGQQFPQACDGMTTKVDASQRGLFELPSLLVIIIVSFGWKAVPFSTWMIAVRGGVPVDPWQPQRFNYHNNIKTVL